MKVPPSVRSDHVEWLAVLPPAVRPLDPGSQSSFVDYLAYRRSDQGSVDTLAGEDVV